MIGSATDEGRMGGDSTPLLVVSGIDYTFVVSKHSTAWDVWTQKGWIPARCVCAARDGVTLQPLSNEDKFHVVSRERFARSQR